MKRPLEISSIRGSVQTVDPAQAALWLGRTERPPRRTQRLVKAYAREMEEGRWKLNGETIVLSEDGALLDGRKRLMAALESGASFTTIVVEGVSRDAIVTIDTLRVRKAGDVLFIQGEAHPRQTAATVNLVYRYYLGAIEDRNSATASDTRAVLQTRPEIRESVERMSALAKLGRQSVAAAVHHLASRVDAPRADRFFDRVTSGDVEPGTPAALLRQAYEASKGADQAYLMALTIIAWNAEHRGKRMRVLRWRQEGDAPEVFPTVSGLLADDGIDILASKAPVLAPDAYSQVDRVSVSIELIDPVKAQELLESNSNNRKVVLSAVDKYGRDMQAGRWALNGQAIKISDTGKLLDGQHRCMASVRRQLPFYAIVVRGLSEDVFDTLDGGRAQTIGDVLSSRGEKHATSLGGALRMLWQYDAGVPQLKTISVSNAELLRVLDSNPGIRESLQYTVNRSRGLLEARIAAVTHFLSGWYNAAEADEFFDRLKDGVGLERRSAVRHLREKLIRNRTSKRDRLDWVAIWALSIKAANAFLLRKPVDLLVWRERESFPLSVGDASRDQSRIQSAA